MGNDDVEFVGIDYESGYNKNKVITFKEIVLNQVKRIGDIWSDEILNHQNFTNAVYTLRAYLNPYYDDDMKLIDENLQEDLIKAKEASLNDDGLVINQREYLIASFNNAVELFTELNVFLKRKRYLNIGSIRD